MYRRLNVLLPVFSILISTLVQAQDQTVWKGELDVGGPKLRLEITIERDDDSLTGKLKSLDQNNAEFELEEIQWTDKVLGFTIPTLGASFAGEFKEEAEIAVGKFRQSGKELDLTLRAGKALQSAEKMEPREELVEAWYGELDMQVVKPIMQFRVMKTQTGETNVYFDSVSEGLAGFSAKQVRHEDTVRFEVSKIQLVFEGKLDESKTRLSGTWTQGSREFPLVLEKHLEAFENENRWENRPQRPREPFPYEAREVKFENKVDQLTLAGTLTLPKGEGTFAAAILISGSGAQDRDESLMGHKPFLVLADYLTRRGIAVLRFDDRGTAESTGTFAGATTADLARDTMAAVDFLETHPQINPDQIGLIGHSEGGLIAPIVCQQRNQVAFSVLLGAPGIDGKEILLSQTKALLLAEGTSEKDASFEQATMEITLRLLDEFETKDEFEEATQTAFDELIGTLPEEDQAETKEKIRTALSTQHERLTDAWMRYFVSYDPKPALKEMTCPVLAITGSNDVQVLPKLNLPEIRACFEAGNNQDFTVRELEGLNHLFQKSTTGGMSEYFNIDETFNEQALKMIGDWLVERTSPSSD